MTLPELTLQIVSYNSSDVLPGLLASLKKQTFKDFVLTVVDNASHDGSADLAAQLFPEATIIRNETNEGFSKAHNQGIALSQSPFVGLVNPDMELHPEALARLMQKLHADTSIGSISGKILKLGDESGIIDSTGILATRYREFVNRGEGERDQGQFDEADAVFAVTGAFVIFRRKALEEVSFQSEFLDNDLFMYKDDVDIGWRLLGMGWKNFYEPRAILYHRRTVRHESEYMVVQRRRRKQRLFNRFSYRNHILVLLKNDSFRAWIFPWPRVFLFEFAKLIFLPLFEWSTLPAIPDVFKIAPRMIKKRRAFERKRRVRQHDLQHWFV